jgi:hypothetical protein
MKKHLVLLGCIVLGLPGCSRQENSREQTETDAVISPNSETEPAPAISAGAVVVEKFEVESGQVDETAIQEGLEAATNTLSELVAKARKSNPELHGSFEGTLHVESDGKVRVFMEGESSLEGGDRQVVDEFVGSIFGKRWAFPVLGEDCLLYVRFRINKS